MFYLELVAQQSGDDPKIVAEHSPGYRKVPVVETAFAQTSSYSLRKAPDVSW